MKDITDLTVTEARYFKIDIIPFRSLITVSNIQFFSSSFAFNNSEPILDDNKNYVGFRLKTGEFRYNNKIFPINYLLIEPDAITFEIQSDSDIAEMFYQNIFELLSKIDPYDQFRKNEPLFKETKTTCVATLAFDFSNIFSKKMNDFIDNKALTSFTTVSNNIANIEMIPAQLSFHVKYDIKDKSLKDNNIRAFTRQFIFEPRAGVSLKEQRFFTSSPTDSNTHLKLLTQSEKTFKKTKRD